MKFNIERKYSCNQRSVGNSRKTLLCNSPENSRASGNSTGDALFKITTGKTVRYSFRAVSQRGSGQVWMGTIKEFPERTIT